MMMMDRRVTRGVSIKIASSFSTTYLSDSIALSCLCCLLTGA